MADVETAREGDAVQGGPQPAQVVARLRRLACPVVMGNAVDGLKERGWHVTGGQNEAGLADAIVRFALQ